MMIKAKGSSNLSEEFPVPTWLSYKPGVETGVTAFSAFVHEMSLTGGGTDKSRHQGSGEVFFTRKREERTCLWRVCLPGWIISLMLYAVPSSDTGLNLLSDACDRED